VSQSYNLIRDQGVRGGGLGIKNPEDGEDHTCWQKLVRSEVKLIPDLVFKSEFLV
jgi:hypothetical protein